jgi:hypothetical protein
LGLGELNLHIHGKDRPLQKWNFDESAFDKLTREAENNRIENGGNSPVDDYTHLDGNDELAVTSVREEDLEDEDAIQDLQGKGSSSNSGSSDFDNRRISSGGSIYNRYDSIMDANLNSSSSSSSSNSSNDRLGSCDINHPIDNPKNNGIGANYDSSDIKIETSDCGTTLPTTNGHSSSIKVRNIQRDSQINPTEDLQAGRNDKAENFQISKQKKIQKRTVINEDDSDTEEPVNTTSERGSHKNVDGHNKRNDNDRYKDKNYSINNITNHQKDKKYVYEKNSYDNKENNEKENHREILHKKEKKSNDTDTSDRNKNPIDKSDRVRVWISSNHHAQIDGGDISDTKKKKRRKGLNENADVIVNQETRRSIQNERKSKQSLSSDSKKSLPSVICPICENELPLGKLTAEHILDKHIDKCTRRMDSVTVKRGRERISKGFYNENDDIESDSNDERQDDVDDTAVASILSKRGRKASNENPDKSGANVSIRDRSMHNGDNDDEKTSNIHIHDRTESRLKVGSGKIEDWMDCEDSSNSSNDADDAYSDPQDSDESTNSEDTFIDDSGISSSKKKRLSRSKGSNEKKKSKKKGVAVDVVDYRLDKKEKKRAEKLLKINSKKRRGTGVDDGGSRVTNRQGRMVEDKVVRMYISFHVYIIIHTCIFMFTCKCCIVYVSKL